MVKKFYMLAVFVMLISNMKAVTVELWPAERRANNTAYLIGNEQNHLLFNISSKSVGGHKISFPEPMNKKATLVIDLPEELKFLGAMVFGNKEFCSDITVSKTSHDGKSFARYEIPLDSTLIHKRTVAANWDYYITAWVASPIRFDGRIYWELKYADDVLASASSRAVTAGVINPELKLPKRFELSIAAGLIDKVPDNDFTHFADFCRRLGINSAYHNYNKELSPESKSYFTALRKAGIKNIANRGGSYGQYICNGFSQKDTMRSGGLETASAKAASMINSQMEKDLFRAVAEYFDEYNIDYEPAGPANWNGYDDKTTIEAFAKKYNISESLTPEILKSKYREQYARYRMELLSRPIFALKEMIDSVKSMPLTVEQGDGVNAHIDYKIYDKVVRLHDPMIYTSSPVNYYQRILAMASYLDPKKIMPDISLGWNTAGICRQAPEGLVMDTVTTAAAGCGGIRHWPGMLWLDMGGLWGFYRGMTIVAHGEDFYFDGSPVNSITAKGISFKSKKINLGSKTLDISEPDWSNTLFHHVHKLNDEYLITFLNYNQDYNAFVKINGDPLPGKYLVNPVEKTYLKENDAKELTVEVPKFSPGLWIMTSDPKRIEGCRQLSQGDILKNFELAKNEFLSSSGKSDIQIGQNKTLNVNYGLLEISGKDTTVINVSTPSQKLSFCSSGGRVIGWNAGGKELVGRKDFSTGGFCMDLLWLPENAHWSGDEISDMKLVKCTNDGKRVLLQYDGEFKKGFPNIRISKTYNIPADKSSLDVNIRLINDTPLPVVLSYWNHNVLSFPESRFVNAEHETALQGNSIFVSESLPEKFMQFVAMPGDIKGKSGNIYAEFFPKTETGIIFKLPDDFMNIYRWNSPNNNIAGSEWMSRPVTIESGASSSMDFSIEIVSPVSVEKLKEKCSLK